LKVVISGSFRKHLQGILDLKKEFDKRGITILKPDKIKTIDNSDRPDFVKFEGEESIPPLVLKMDYLKAIKECDAHIIYNKDSYWGNSATTELGISEAYKKKIYFIEMPNFEKMISSKGVTDECEKEDIKYFYKYLLGGIEVGVFRVGIEQLYKDFNIEEPTIDEERWNNNYNV